MSSKRKIYVTTSIPYVNSRPHIGHALELVQADAIARYHRLAGREVCFQTGTDENAFKNVLAAGALGISPKKLVDLNSGVFQALVQRLNISADGFIRTTELRHRVGVAAFWNQLKQDDLYVRRYEGLYCVGCEDFYMEKDLVDGKCPDHGLPPRPVQEENIFFRLSSYQTAIENLIASDRLRVVPSERKNEVLSFIRSGLQDISVSRSSERSSGWGIPVPGDPSQVIYVWIDALINYVTGLGFGAGGEWERTWNEDTWKVHVIGKNVWKFHAVYWPALLLSAQLPLPNELFVHGFLTENGRKISKSLGNSIDPFEYEARFGADGLRHYLLKATSPFDDGDFSSSRIASIYQSDLANGLGNLVSRVTSLCSKSGYPEFVAPQPCDAPPGFEAAFDDYRLGDAAQILWTVVNSVNRDVTRIRPWELLKSGEHAALQNHLARWLNAIHQVACWIGPYLPSASSSILKTLRTIPLEAANALFPRVQERNLPVPDRPENTE